MPFLPRSAPPHACKQFEYSAVGPPEPDLVRAVAEPDIARDVRLAAPDVVLLDYRAVLAELLRDQRHELRRQPIRIVVVAVAPQTGDGDHLERRPSERRVPLIAGHLGARQQSARRLELSQVAAHARRLRL